MKPEGEVVEDDGAGGEGGNPFDDDAVTSDGALGVAVDNAVEEGGSDAMRKRCSVFVVEGERGMSAGRVNYRKLMYAIRDLGQPRQASASAASVWLLSSRVVLSLSYLIITSEKCQVVGP